MLTFQEAEIGAIAQVFQDVIQSQVYTCYACAIMPDHIHILIRKHRDRAEEMIKLLQLPSCEAVRALEIRDRFHPVWGGCGWKVFLDSVEDMTRTIEYVRDNPIKARLPAQSWEFVSPYDNWPCLKRGR